MHVIAAKAVAFKEALDPEFKTYQAQVVNNAQAMAKTMIGRGYKIVSGGTENHLMLIDLIGREFTGKDAEAALGKAHITVNKNAVPDDPRSPFVTSGLRIGTPAVTTRGYQEPDCVALANWICDVLDDAGRRAGDRRRARERHPAVPALPGLRLSPRRPDALPLLPARRHPRDRLARVRGWHHDPAPARVRAVPGAFQHLRDGRAEAADAGQERWPPRGLRRAQAAHRFRAGAAEAAGLRRADRRRPCAG